MLLFDQTAGTEPYKAALYHEAEPVFLIMYLIEPAWIDSLKMNQCNDLSFGAHVYVYLKIGYLFFLFVCFFWFVFFGFCFRS